MAQHAPSRNQPDGTSIRPAREDLPGYAKTPIFGWILAITGFVSWIASSALTLERLEIYKNPDYVTSCDMNPFVSCGSVMRTAQAALFGFPNPLIGVAGFAVLTAIGITLIAGATLPRWYFVGLQIGVTLAMAMIGWLWFQALYVIGILCPYCMVVWAMMIVVFTYTTARNISHGVIPAPAGVRKFLAEWHWVIVSLIVLLCAGSILITFAKVFFG
ncbi:MULTISPECIES: vitamin K epoxide reductase family protein [Micrococcaceae]|uniref:Vitamin K epoxide reductase n=1 Tax=Arthrobacter rhombi TaxID=71253 RepID=A0A1R4FVX2_9MICC|nr:MULTISPECIES: vitamin K epoxide reductase family protein [Micrococcaceae]SJM60069.1 Vitamin K epoxide reductase [Arthrobacter rhombi]